MSNARPPLPVPRDVRDPHPSTVGTRRAAAASGASTPVSSQLAGRNSRQSSAADAQSVAACTDTPTWQFPTSPACRSRLSDLRRGEGVVATLYSAAGAFTR